MNKFLNLLVFSTLFFFPSEISCQEEIEGPFFYHVSIRDFDSLEITEKEDGTLEVFSLESFKENQIYKQAVIHEFQQAFPNTLKDNLKIVYRITTDSESLLPKLEAYNPQKYSRIGQYFPAPVSYYPNDYGTTSPVENLGAPYPQTGLDLINAPGAWGITSGNKKVVIGISDSKVDSTNPDLKGRVSQYLRYFNIESGGICSHGTTIAGIIGAKKDNAYGLAGLCSDCDMITNGYGQFDRIQELVEAGAKVINASWVLCGFGAYHQNIEERINEYYDEGILIVAAAGNAKICNRDLRDHASNYGYPASYKRVISATTIYAECGHYEDCIIDDERFGEVHYKLKDRHVRQQRLTDGKLMPLDTQWATQHNLSVDISAPAEGFSLGKADCGEEVEYGGLTSSSAPYVTGVIGLIWSVNYCLGSAEVESVLKLTSVDIENLPGNESLKMKLGAGRLDAYKAVKMAQDMQLEKGIVEVTGRDFYRFDFELRSAPYKIAISNQTFRDSSTVDFKARKSIHLKKTHLKPDSTGFIKLAIDPDLPTEECFPTKPVIRPKVARDSVTNHPRFKEPFIIRKISSIQGVEVEPVEGVVDEDYKVYIIHDDEVIFKKKFNKTEKATIPLEEVIGETVKVRVLTTLFLTDRLIRVSF